MVGVGEGPLVGGTCVRVEVGEGVEVDVWMGATEAVTTSVGVKTAGVGSVEVKIIAVGEGVDPQELVVIIKKIIPTHQMIGGYPFAEDFFILPIIFNGLLSFYMMRFYPDH